MSILSNKFSSFTLNDLQSYVLRLERDNELMRQELKSASYLITVLENIAKTCQTGYSLLRKIEINKSCECNEHLNESLRRYLSETVVDSNKWLDQYEKVKSNFEYYEESLGCMTPHDSDSDDSLSTIAEYNEYQKLAFDKNKRLDDKEAPIYSLDLRVQNKSCISNQSNDKEKEMQSERTRKAVECMLNAMNGNKAKSVQMCADDSSIEAQLFKCDKCDVNFSQKENLEQHLVSHSANSINKSMLNMEIKVRRPGPGRPPKNAAYYPLLPHDPDDYKRTRYSGIGRYRCPWPDCHYTPHFLRDLRRHMHKHTGEKRYKCDIDNCDFVTVWKTSLLQHQRKKHSINPFTNKYNNSLSECHFKSSLIDVVN